MLATDLTRIMGCQPDLESLGTNVFVFHFPSVTCELTLNEAGSGTLTVTKEGMKPLEDLRVDKRGLDELANLAVIGYLGGQAFFTARTKRMYTQPGTSESWLSTIFGSWHPSGRRRRHLSPHLAEGCEPFIIGSSPP